MVILDNLVKYNNLIEYDYYGVGDTQYGHVIFDVEKMQCVNVKYSGIDAESNLQRLYRKSLFALNEMIEANNYISRYEYFWY